MTRDCLLLCMLCVLLVGVAVPGSAATGVLYSPGGTREGSGICLETYRQADDDTLRGVALWFAGSLAPTPDVDTTIPHGDFRSESYDSRIGLLYLYGREAGKVAVIGGLGLALVSTEYLDISNVTGWSWEGGAESSIRPQAQLGLRVALGDSGGLRLGLDSHFGAFGGFSVGF